MSRNPDAFTMSVAGTDRGSSPQSCLSKGCPLRSPATGPELLSRALKMCYMWCIMLLYWVYGDSKSGMHSRDHRIYSRVLKSSVQ